MNKKHVMYAALFIGFSAAQAMQAPEAPCMSELTGRQVVGDRQTVDLNDTQTKYPGVDTESGGTECNDFYKTAVKAVMSIFELESQQKSIKKD